MIPLDLRLGSLRFALGTYRTGTLVVYLVTLAGREFTFALPLDVERYVRAFAAGALLCVLGWLGFVAYVLAMGGGR